LYLNGQYLWLSSTKNYIVASLSDEESCLGQVSMVIISFRVISLLWRVLH